ncbi:hypothetical protein Clacol_009201 [Clathrus columnatus]|uniref:Uncharacterized protein n=1 Tax=Clathrus columnatus TaxID=1419009 RepID=A0AAV5ARE4_9AGAM|nr:hypothetical protein Clacol_009201 [Clathrus columnatus]
MSILSLWTLDMGMDVDVQSSNFPGAEKLIHTDSCQPNLNRITGTLFYLDIINIFSEVEFEATSKVTLIALSTLVNFLILQVKINRSHSTSPDIGLSSANSNIAGGFDILILSDLLHFDSSHGEITQSIVLMLDKTDDARVYVVAGKYTRREICESFIKQATTEGLVWEEIIVHDEQGTELGRVNSEDRALKWGGEIIVGDGLGDGEEP